MTINAMTVSPGEAVKAILATWKIQQNTEETDVIMLHGGPGSGKTQLVQQVAKAIGGTLYDFRITQIDTSNLRGLPYYDHEEKKTKWYRPEDLPDTDAPAVMFFDEITAAEPHLTPSVYGILQERRCGMHLIPKNTLIIAAGNTVDDGAIAYEMGTALADRMTHFIIVPSTPQWIEDFALPNKLHPSVIAFLKTRPDLLVNSEECLKNDLMIAATPRSWEVVSRYMYHVEDPKIRYALIAGRIGEQLMADFRIVAEDIEATVQVVNMVKVARSERVKMYPITHYGLEAMTYGLNGFFSQDRKQAKEMLSACIEILYDLGELIKLRPNDKEILLALPLAEMRVNAFEQFMGKAIEFGLAEEFNDNPTFQQYNNERIENGLV